MKIAAAAAEFLNQKRIAVTGVSESSRGAQGATRCTPDCASEGTPCSPSIPMPGPPRRSDVLNLAAIPGGVDAVVIATAADRAPATMREIVDLGIKYAWMHRAFRAWECLGGGDADRSGRPG